MSLYPIRTLTEGGLTDLITLCAWCRKIRNENGHWEMAGEEYSEAMFTHGICPECLRKQNPELYDEMLKDGSEDR